MGPREVDDLYLWEIATILGVAKEIQTADTTNDSSDDGPRPPTDGPEGARELLRQRMAAAKGLGPEPVSPPIDPKAFKAAAGALRVG